MRKPLKSVLTVSMVFFLLSINACIYRKASDDEQTNQSQVIELPDSTQLLSLNGQSSFRVEIARHLKIPRKVVYIQNGGLLDSSSQKLEYQKKYCSVDSWGHAGKEEFPTGTLEHIVFVKNIGNELKIGLQGIKSDLVSISCYRDGNAPTDDMTYGEFKAMTSGYFRIGS